MPTACHICQQTKAPKVTCKGCRYRFCKAKCMSVSPDPDVDRDFLCPDCHGDNDLNCPYATRLFRAPSVAVLTLSLLEFEHCAKYLRDSVRGTLLAAGMPEKDVFSAGFSLEEVARSTFVMKYWLAVLPVTTTLFVYIVTETILPGYWIIDSSNPQDPIGSEEVKFLDTLFVDDPNVTESIHSFRQSYLFVVSCGGNYLTLDERPALKTWVWESQSFKNMFGFLNPRLSAGRLHSFFAKLTLQICVKAKPLNKALVDCYTRDEDTRAHTDIVWFGQSRVTVLRYAPPRTRPHGFHLPAVESYCRCESTATKRWIEGRAYTKKPPVLKLAFHTSCCKVQVRLTFPNGAAEVESNANVTFVKDIWPGKRESKLDLIGNTKRTTT